MKIAISIVVALFLIGCGEDSTQKTAQTDTTSPQTQATAQATVVKSEPVAEKEVSQKVEEIVAKVSEKTEEVVGDAVEKTSEAITTAADGTKETAQKAVSSMTDTMASMMPSSSTVSGENIFKTCASCHGQNGEKAALNKSQIIQGWDAAKIAAALKGYKDGSYGGAMKGVMKGQVTKLSDEEIQAVSEYVSKL